MLEYDLGGCKLVGSLLMNLVQRGLDPLIFDAIRIAANSSDNTLNNSNSSSSSSSNSSSSSGNNIGSSSGNNRLLIDEPRVAATSEVVENVVEIIAGGDDFLTDRTPHQDICVAVRQHSTTETAASTGSGAAAAADIGGRLEAGQPPTDGIEDAKNSGDEPRILNSNSGGGDADDIATLTASSPVAGSADTGAGIGPDVGAVAGGGSGVKKTRKRPAKVTSGGINAVLKSKLIKRKR